MLFALINANIKYILNCSHKEHKVCGPYFQTWTFQSWTRSNNLPQAIINMLEREELVTLHVLQMVDEENFKELLFFFFCLLPNSIT